MKKIEAIVGMRLIVTKMNSTDANQWGLSEAHDYIGKSGVVSEIHSDYQAIQLFFHMDANGRRIIHWFHEDDLAKPIKVEIKKGTFDPQNLVMGV